MSMPITQERENIQDLRAVGFTENQAIVLAAKLEAASQATSQDLKGFMVAELDKRFGEVDKRFGEVDKRFGELESRMDVGFAQLEARFERALRLQLAAILTAIVGVTGLAVAIIKLFPNAH
jgi:hypothetical protein